MKLGDLVRYIAEKSKGPIGIVVDVDLIELDDTKLDFENKSAVRVFWLDIVTVEFEDELDVLSNYSR